MKQGLLITGVSGMLGSNLAYALREKFAVSGFYCAHLFYLSGVETFSVDITDEARLRRELERIQPDYIIHCAAMADVDACEEHPSLAEEINVRGTRRLVECLQGTKTKLLYISTDAVFDGTKAGKYHEDDVVRPPHVYGRTKYAGEQEALALDRTLVARVNIFGWNTYGKRSLAQWIVSELSAGRRIKGFTDVIFSSLYTFLLAGLLEKALSADLRGIYHFASATSLSKYDFAVQLAEIFGLNTALIEPASVDDFQFKARRAKNLALDTAKCGLALGCQMPSLPESMKAFYADFQKDKGNRIKSGINVEFNRTGE